MSEAHQGPGDDLLWKYVLGECTDAERNFVETSVQNNPELKSKLSRLSIYVKSSDFSQEPENYERDKVFLDKATDVFPVVKVLTLLILIILLFFLFAYLKSRQ